MKKQLSYLALCIALPLSVTHAGVTITPFYGYHHSGLAWDEQKDALKDKTDMGYAKDNDAAYGVAVGGELTPSIALEAEYLNANTDVRTYKGKTDANQKFNQENISLNLVFNSDFITQKYDSALKPYVLLGVGMGNYQVINKADDKTLATSSDFLTNFGVGAKYRLTDFLAVKSELRGIYNTSNSWFEGLALAGIELTLGGHSKPVIPEPPSFDFEEEIPAEPQQEVVEVTQAIPVQPMPVIKQKDTDGDGVADMQDKCPNTPNGANVHAMGCSQVELVPLRVYFDSGKTNIKPRFVSEIKKVADIMSENKQSRVVIEGHTSKTGSRSFNLKLSQARADSVKAMLVNQYGINSSRISAKGYGWEKPIAPNTNATGRALNQRVLAVITQ